MSNIIIPDADGKLPDGYREEIRLPAIEIPHHLQRDLDANPHLVPDFYKAVGDTLNRTLNHPQTRLRVITEPALKERVELCYRVLVVLRYDLRYSLKKAFDLLPSKVLEALLRGERPEDTFERTAQRNAWVKEGSVQQAQVDPAELVDHTAELTEPDDE